jgi:hypothetical protein
MLVRPLAENKKGLALDYAFFFGIAPKKKQKRSSAGKIKLPTFSLLLKFPKLVVVPPPQTAGNFNATASCGYPVESFNARGSREMNLFFASISKNYWCIKPNFHTTLTQY